MALRAFIGALGFTAIFTVGACEPGITPPPPPPVPVLPPVTPISQCKDVFPDTYTRPVPTGRPIFLLPSTKDQRKIMWLDRSCNYWYVGPYDPAHAPYFCWYRPDLGDRYYANYDQAMFVGVPPQACPGDALR